MACVEQKDWKGNELVKPGRTTTLFLTDTLTAGQFFWTFSGIKEELVEQLVGLILSDSML